MDWEESALLSVRKRETANTGAADNNFNVLIMLEIQAKFLHYMSQVAQPFAPLRIAPVSTEIVEALPHADASSQPA